MASHPIRLFSGGRSGPYNVVANGVLVWVGGTSNDTRLHVKTAQGNFTVRLGDIPYGQHQTALAGNAWVDRVPFCDRITDTPDEQDYPALATDKNGNVWLAYIEFRHYKNHDRLRANLAEAPTEFSEWRAPPGGDQLLVRKYSQGEWGQPISVTPSGRDLYRAAIAVDRLNRPWVFWSSNEKGHFNLWACAIENGKLRHPMQLTGGPGSDIDPVATSDSQGRVWVAWQGWRQGRAAIYVTVQQGDSFGPPFIVSSSSSNEWNPSIAADRKGRVTVAWDSYRNGNYDVFLRTATAPASWSKEIPVAASARYEAYPSITYDREGRLWVAYEEGAEGWGKDFGAYDTTGVALYQGRAVRLRGFDSTGSPLDTKADVASVLPGFPQEAVTSSNRQNDSDDWLKPDPTKIVKRKPHEPVEYFGGPRNSMPRLLVDDSGRLWLAFRNAHPIWWNPIGSVWSEYLVSYEGNQWTGPIFLANSDNLLDNRPALVSVRPGEVLIVGSSDGRRHFYLSERGAQRAAIPPAAFVPDPYNNDLYAHWIVSPALTSRLEVKGGTRVGQRPRNPADVAEESALDGLRSYRVRNRYGTLRILRGEFHRHSEISGDGGDDGTLWDQFRYILDPAGMDWAGCCDHDNGGGREYSWWITQKLTDVLYSPGNFVPMFSYERSVAYPEGHRNVVFAQRGVRPLPRLPRVDPAIPGRAPDTQMLYAYLRQFGGIAASHTSATRMGTDWRDNDPSAEPVVEIYQGDRQNYEMPGAPRAPSEQDSIHGWRPKGFINLALEMGYKLGFQSGSDHISTHMSYCNVYVTDGSREAILDGLRKRHVYATTDNILADVRSGDFMMGDVLSTATLPELRIKLVGTAPFVRVHVIKDNKYVYSSGPRNTRVEFSWRDVSAQPGKTSFYYVRGEQEDGQIVWASPMWITYRAP
jgi:hypothetical protein